MDLSTNPGDQEEQLHLSDICADCLMLILRLRTSQNFGDAEILRQRIISILNDIERTAKRQGFPMEDIQQAKFALVAFLDESLIASDWEGKEQWLANPLQLQLFNRFDAGDEFYNRVQNLLNEIKLNTEVLEVYYLCLTLGFKGKYAYLEQEMLRTITDDIHQELALSNPKLSGTLSPHGKRKEEVAEVIRSEVPLWSIAVGAAAIVLVIYFIFSLFSIGTVHSVVNRLTLLL